MTETKLPKELLTPREMAAMTGIYIETIRQAIAHGEMKAVRLSPKGNSKMRVRPADFAAWLESKQTKHEHEQGQTP